MFYSHEILTDRKHGVATIWLVATLGARSSLKKITRKAIMDVDVPNACGSITDPAAPMALRLQGNLLYGVSRVFSQQCAYVLTDMQSLRDKMRGLDIVLKALEVDPNVVVTRPEQLNLQTDPTFNIDLDLGFDLSSFDLGSSTEPSSLLSPRTLPSSQTGSLDHEDFLGPALPLDHSSSHGGIGDGFDFVFDDVNSGLQDDNQSQGVLSEARAAGNEDVEMTEGDAYEDDNLLDITEDGTVIVRDRSERDSRVSDPIVANDDFPASELQDEHSGLVAGPGNVDADVQDALADDGFDFDNDDHPDPGMPRTPEPRPEPGIVASQQAAEEIESETNEDADIVTGTAHQRATKIRVVPFDDPPEVPNRVLAEWNDNYIDFMEMARVEKMGKISITQAKRNAAYWVLDQGLGDVASNFREDYEQHPLAIFSGQDLIDSLLVPTRQTGSKKRSASAIDDDDNSADGTQKSKKARTESADRSPSTQRGRGELQAMSEDELDVALGDDDVEIEFGRGEQAPLSDHQSDMPWNAYVSSRAGSVRRGLSVAGASSSMHGRGAIDVNLPSSNVKRISQLIRESPLDRRRRMMQSPVLGGSSNQDNTDLMSLGGGFELEDHDLDARLAADPDVEFELNEPVEASSTQDIATYRWDSENLEEEAFNFLDYLYTSVKKKEQGRVAEIDAEENTSMTFAELLPTNSINEVAAAQGLLHVLSLATKGLINVRQDMAFGDINLSIVGEMFEEGEDGNEEVNEAEEEEEEL